MPKKLILDFDLSSDFYIIGICTTLQDYRLAWYLNKQASLHLVKQKDFPVKITKESTDNLFSFFIDESVVLQYYLIQNKTDNGFLFQNQKKLDYLLFIKDTEGLFDPTTIINQLKNVTQITFMYLIENSTIKNIKNFLSDMELHVLEIINTKKDEHKKKHYMGKD